jgi:hypothetical protein
MLTLSSVILVPVVGRDPFSASRSPRRTEKHASQLCGDEVRCVAYDHARKPQHDGACEDHLVLA